MDCTVVARNDVEAFVDVAVAVVVARRNRSSEAILHEGRDVVAVVDHGVAKQEDNAVLVAVVAVACDVVGGDIASVAVPEEDIGVAVVVGSNQAEADYVAVVSSVVHRPN